MKNIFLCCIAMYALCATAQDRKEIDSLLTETDASKPDSIKMKAYYQLGKRYMDNNASKAIEYFAKAIPLALKEGKLLIAANSHYSTGYCYKAKSEFEKSLYNYQQSEKYYEQMKDSFRLSNALMAMGNVYTEFNKPEKMAAYYNRAEQLVIEMNDSVQLANIYDERGIIFDKASKYDSAAMYIKKAYQISMSLGDSLYAYAELSNLGLTYKHKHMHPEAINCFDSVLAYYERENFPLFNRSIIYNNLGATYAQWGKYDKAKEAFNTSLDYGGRIGATNVLMENYRNMADMFGDMKDYQQQAGSLTKYYHLKDSLFDIDAQNRVTQLESDYQIEKKNTEIAKKEAEVGKQKSQRNIFIILASAAALLLGMLLFFYKRMQNINKALTEKNEQINEQKNQLQNLNHVKDRLFSIISHDLRNPLATLRSYLLLTEDEGMPAEKKKQFRLQAMNMTAATSDMLDNLLAWANVQIKNVKASITPISISDCVADTVHGVNAQAEQKQIAIEQNIAADTALGDYDILSIALRNLVTNAVKFSKANSQVHINSSNQNGHILLSVKDEGVGMSEAQIEEVLSGANNSSEGTAGEKGSGLGLFLVRELLEKINAELLIESKEGEGSQFTVVLARV